MSLAVTATVLTAGKTVTALTAGKTVIDVIGANRAGKAQKEAYREQAAISAAEAEHRKQVAYHNAGVFREHASRIREVQVGRINEYLTLSAERLAQQQEQVLQRGVEEENKVRRSTADLISTQRAAAGAGGIRIDTGTPASLQIDSARLGEVDALRVRRNHRLEGEKIMQQLSDLQRDSEYAISDLNYEADSYDERAALTVLEGDAELAAGLNRSAAYQQAGSAARRASIWDAAGAALGGTGQTLTLVDPKWLQR